MSGWSTESMADVLELIGGGTPKTTNPEYWNGDIPWLSVVDFNTGKKFVFDTEKKITEKGLATHKMGVRIALGALHPEKAYFSREVSFFHFHSSRQIWTISYDIGNLWHKLPY